MKDIKLLQNKKKELVKRYSICGRIFGKEKFFVKINEVHDPNEGYKVSYVYTPPRLLNISGKFFVISLGICKGSLRAPQNEIDENKPHLLLVPLKIRRSEFTDFIVGKRIREIARELFNLSYNSRHLMNDGAFISAERIRGNNDSLFGNIVSSYF